ncbi:MAG TPA: tetratricopeptide repeat protein [Chitinophagaceae bacterium]
MKKPQWITIGTATLLVAFIFIFGRTVPLKKASASVNSQQNTNGRPEVQAGISTDTILAMAKMQLSPEQVVRLNTLEHSISRGDVKDQQLHVYHQLARFWSDSAHIFEPFAWYEAEAARLENSGKSLTFAAHLFLDNLQSDEVVQRRQWKALQAKDLFERSLKINPDDDSAKVGLGACFLFGNISATPMEGILKIREVVQKDSTNIYAQMMLIQGSLISGQYDKAINRLQMVNRLAPANVEAIVLLADMYDRTGDKASAVVWYRKSLQYVKQPEARTEIEKRIKDLSK